jgi:hypothetical protein
MDMGVVHQILTPGVEDGDKTNLSHNTPAQFEECFLYRFEEDIVENLLVS